MGHTPFLFPPAYITVAPVYNHTSKSNIGPQSIFTFAVNPAPNGTLTAALSFYLAF